MSQYEKFCALSIEDRLKEPVSGRSVLTGMKNFMYLYTHHLLPKGFEIKKFSYMFDPGWELSDGLLCAELFFKVTKTFDTHQAEVIFTIPCYWLEGSDVIDIHYEVFINGKHHVDRSSDVMHLSCEVTPLDITPEALNPQCCPRLWTNQLWESVIEAPVESNTGAQS